MISVLIIEELLKVVVEGLCKLLCCIVDVMTGDSINVEQVWKDPCLDTGLATSHDATRMLWLKKSQSTLSKLTAFTFMTSRDPKCSTTTFLVSSW